MTRPRTWFVAPTLPRFHCSESGVADVNGFTPCEPPAHASVFELRHTDLIACAVTAGCTTYQLSPPSCVPTITPPSPTAQPFVVSLNDTLLSCCAVGFSRAHVAPPSPTAQPLRPSGTKNTPFSWFVVPLGCAYQPFWTNTATIAVSALPPAEATSDVTPSPTAVTRPEVDTVITPGSPLVKSMPA